MQSLQAQLIQKIGYPFQQHDQLQLALTHRSYNGNQNNERLEFLGDSILNFIMGEALFQLFPHAREGQLSRLRATLVKGTTLTQIAKQLELGPHLLLGQGELKSGGSRRDSILADAVEAIIGAVYLEAGLDPCRSMVLSWFQPRLQKLNLDQTVKDNKTRLQEWLQSQKLPLPQYRILDVKGKSHSQYFTVECLVEDRSWVTQGEGQSRRQAEQVAAGHILDIIDELGHTNLG